MMPTTSPITVFVSRKLDILVSPKAIASVSGVCWAAAWAVGLAMAVEPLMVMRSLENIDDSCGSDESSEPIEDDVVAEFDVAGAAVTRVGESVIAGRVFEMVLDVLKVTEMSVAVKYLVVEGETLVTVTALGATEVFEVGLASDAAAEGDCRVFTDAVNVEAPSEDRGRTELMRLIVEYGIKVVAV